MNKKSFIAIVSILVIGLIFTELYDRFTTKDKDRESDYTYNMNLNGSTSDVVVPSNSSKTIMYQVTNNESDSRKYAVIYSGNNIDVMVYDDSQDKTTGIINAKKSKFIKLYIYNKGNTENIASIKTVFDYEEDDLENSNIIPSGYNLVDEIYK